MHPLMYMCWEELQKRPQYVAYSPGSAAATVQGNIAGFANVTALRNLAVQSINPNQYLIVCLLGLANPGDRQGGMFYFDPASATNDDGVTVIKTADTTGNGRFLKFI